MILNFFISLIIVFTGSNLENKIDNYLKSKLSNYAKYEFKIRSVPNIGKDKNEIEIDKNKKFKVSGKYCYVPVKIHKGSRTLNSVISLEIKLYNEVFVARRVLKRGENLSRSDFNVKLDEVTKYRNEIVEQNTPIEFFRIKRQINLGEVLTADKIEGIPAVKKNAKVMASLVSGSIVIQLPAVARQDGIIGEVIRINADQKYYRAEVIDSYNVKIVE